MDFKTGNVGEVLGGGISWQSIGEALYVEPAPGIKGGSPKKERIRVLANSLVRAGLLRTKSVGKQLIFYCVLADTDKSDQNKAHTNNTPQEHTSLANTEPKTSNKLHTPKTEKEHTPPVSGIKSSTSPENAPSQDDDDNTVLIFPEKLNPQQIEGIRKAAKGFNAVVAQDLIDELAGHIAAKDIKNPIGYFRRIVGSVKDGSFRLERGLNIQAGRARQAEIQRQQAESKKAGLPTGLAIKSNKKRAARPSLSKHLKNLNKNGAIK